MKKTIIVMAWLCCLALTAVAQQFVNLTAEQVRIDSVLPVVTHRWLLPSCDADTVYTPVIEYPEFIDMAQGDVERYHRITADTLPPLPLIDSWVSIDRKQAIMEATLVPLAFREGKYRKLVSYKISLRATPRTVAAQGKASSAALAPLAASRYASHSVLAQGRWAKIRVGATGVCELTADVVAKAGFADINKVKIYGYGGALQPESLDGTYLTNTDDLKQVPRCVVGGRHLFYAQGPVSWKSNAERVRNPYSDYGYYFITENEESVQLLSEADFLASFYPGSEARYALHEIDDYSWYHGGRNLYESKEIGSGETTTYTLDVPRADVAGTLRVVLTANGAATVAVQCNGASLGNVNISGLASEAVASVASGVYQVSALQASNTIALTNKSNSTVRLDYIAIECSTPAEAPNLGAACQQAEYVHNITNQDLHAHTSVDMVIIIPTSQKLRAQAERLKKLHEERHGITVRIVPADELYNEFSSGTPDVTAYRRYMKMFYDRAETADDCPSYLLLMGDGAWDNRLHLTGWEGVSADDLLLCYESENSYSKVYCYVSDDFYCLLDDGEQIQSGKDTEYKYRGKPDVAVGRYPVRTEAEARVMIDKLEAYLDNTSAGAWQNTVVFMGDDGNGNIHMEAADNAAKSVERNYPGYEVKRVMWDSFNRVTSAAGNTYPEITSLLQSYMKNGALVMDYCGHGAAYSISHEMVLKLSDFSSIPSTRLPLWITASCDVMPFDGQISNIGESAVLYSSGGAIAFLGTTRTVYSSQNEIINTSFITEVLNNSSNRVSMAEALRIAKNKLVDSGRELSVNKLQYSFLGDPVLKLAYPTGKMVIDEINGMAVTPGEKLEMKAGSVVNVSGHVETNGAVDEQFSGTMTASVMDAAETVVCKMNDTSQEGTSKAYTYTDFTNTVYRGTNTVSQGKFAFSFAVPKDIRYGDANGRINLYAVSSDKKLTANGYSNDIHFKGTGEMSVDGVGPAIYCYLNSPSFVNGEEVNTTPYFVAELSDEDGINASGSGIGHDLQLVIDGDPLQTYTLNDYFNYSFGSYKQGTVGFSIPTLSAGSHQLQFKAWDVVNNLSVATLNFTVVRGQQPQLVDVDCTQNPATTSTSFRVVHNRMGSQIEVVIDLFDMSGRRLWTSEHTVVPEQSMVEIPWNLSIDGGRSLGTGVYLYRVRVASDGSSYASKAKKLIVISGK